MAANVHKQLADLHTEVEHIPGGYTLCLQTMDMGGNKEFKDGVCHCVDDWMFTWICNPNKNLKSKSSIFSQPKFEFYIFKLLKFHDGNAKLNSFIESWKRIIDNGKFFFKFLYIFALWNFHTICFSYAPIVFSFGVCSKFHNSICDFAWQMQSVIWILSKTVKCNSCHCNCNFNFN